MQRATCAELVSDLLALNEDVRHGVGSKQALKGVSTWHIWCNFCCTIDTTPDLSKFKDPVKVLLPAAGEMVGLHPKGSQSTLKFRGGPQP